MSYLLVSLPQEIWKISNEDFIQQLTQKYPLVEIEQSVEPDALFSVEWNLYKHQIYLSGYLDRDPQMINLDGPLLECITFALWARDKFLLQNLAFLDENYTFSVFLKDRTAEQIYEISRAKIHEIPNDE